jgi:hypothetical protein
MKTANPNGIQMAMAHLKKTGVEPCIFSMLCGIFAVIYTTEEKNFQAHFVIRDSSDVPLKFQWPRLPTQ